MQIIEYQEKLQAIRQRGLVFFSGEPSWCEAQITDFFSQPKLADKRIYSYGYVQAKVENSTVLDDKNFRHFLGTECDYFIYYADTINPDVFAAISGTIKAGGLLLFSLNKPLSELSFFEQRFVAMLEKSQTCLTLLQDQKIVSASAQLPVFSSVSSTTKTASLPYHAITEDQVAAVEAIHKVAKGHRNRPLTMSADRGRGKTTALALACIELIQASEQGLSIVVTAPKLSSLERFFSCFKQYLPSAIIEKDKVEYLASRVEFLPLEQLLSTPKKVHLLLVDEAAALPLYMIDKLFSIYRRLVFSSTLHGYEGAGRGFAIKCKALHEKHLLTQKMLTLNTPIRWSVDDSLESLVYRACLLNAEIPIFSEVLAPADKSYVRLTSQQLIDNEVLLQQVFSVLVTAHYQTSPNDLKLMLDNEHIGVHAVMINNTIVAVALVMQEGGLEQQDIEDIQLSKRRIRDQFIPQALLTHCGQVEAFEYTYWRVMRIAVHPSMQQQGLGKFLMSSIEAQAHLSDIDLLGTSFALNRSLYAFWRDMHWTMARIGFSQDHASGEYSGLLLKPIKQSAQVFSEQVTEQFYQSFTFLLAEQYSRLDSALVCDVLANMPPVTRATVNESDLTAVGDFAKGTRLYDQCAYGLHVWLLAQTPLFNEPMNKAQLQSIHILIARLLQKHSLKQVIEQYGFIGKKQLHQFLQQQLTSLLDL